MTQAAPDRDPDRAQALGRAVVVQGGRTDVPDGRQGAFDSADDVGDRDLGGGPGQRVAALGAALGPDDPGPAQVG